MSTLSGPTSEGIFTITFDDSATPDHRLSKAMFESLHKHLDVVENHGGPPLYLSDHESIKKGSRLKMKEKIPLASSESDSNDPSEKRQGKPTALIITGPNSSKFWSNGFAFDYLGSNWSGAFEDLHRLCLRLLLFPVPTIACLQGHCFAGAVFLALACDFRVMNIEKGFMCLNELQDQKLFAKFQNNRRHMTIPFSDQMMQLINVKANRYDVKSRLLLGAERINGSEAYRLGLVDYTGSNAADTYQKSLDVAKMHSKKGSNHELWRTVKERLVGRENLDIMMNWKFDGDPREKSKL